MVHDLKANFPINKWSIGFVGKGIDDRSVEAIKYLEDNCEVIIRVFYSAEDFAFSFDNSIVNIDNISDALISMVDKSIVLESTSLGFVEMLMISKALKNLGGIHLDYLYLEPFDYRSKNKKLVLHKREFELSGEVLGYKAIPGFSKILSDEVNQQIVFFLGFESSRLDRAMEDYQMINPKSSSVVFGVPAFKPGWEIDSFANNIPVINDRKIRGGVHYCAANNPLSAFQTLTNISKGLEIGEQLFVVPIGTKPLAIGIALFAIQNPSIGILYDHPTKEKGRTGKVSKWNLYSVDL